MANEIERKFLVRGDYKSEASAAERIVQGYISSSRGRTVRVRIRGEKAYLTIKGPSDEGGLARFEWEKEISIPEAEDLFSIAEPGVIDKVRHLVPSADGKHVWEVDEFHGENEGLTVAEIELDSEDDTFPKPSWLGEEVTGDRRYYNSCLVKNPFKNW